MRQIVRRSWWGWCAGLAHRRGPRLLAVGTDSQSPHRRAKRATLRFEPLEERQLLASDLVITEFAASNGNTLPDSDGDRSDWIEIHNRTDEPVQLQGWYLTDDANELTRWTFPSIQLAPRGYQIVFASGKDRAYDSFRLTTDFHATPDGTFRIDLDAGLYDIRLTVGDAKKARDEMAISIQSERLDVLSTDAGEFIARTYRAEVTADSGGQLAIRIEDLGGETGRAAINALSITPAVGGTPHRFDFGKEDSPLEPGFTRVTATDTYRTVAGFGWDAGVALSEVDRGVEQGELHTNFKLSSRGEYLALVEPDGTTIAFEYAPEYPPQQTAVSYGLEQEEVVSTPVGTGAEAAILVPTAANGGDLLGRSWTAVDFDDSAWRDGPTGVGFVDSESLQDLIATDIRSEMQGITASAYLRVPFTIEQPRAVFSLQLRMAYDDGYVAYLNGVEVARANAPDTLGPNSEATSTRSDLFARDFEEIDISEQIGLLRDGTNVLAIQGLNRRASGDPFFLVHPELQVGRSLDIRRVEPRYFASPTPGTPNGLNSFAALTPTPQVNIAGGLFDEPFDVVVNSDVPGATLVITTDGSRPTLENGLQVDGADAETRPTTTISVSGTTVLRAAAFNEDWMPSRMTARTYIFPDDVIAQDVQATLDAGFPERWGDRTVATSPGNGVPDYGLDPDIIGPNDLFGGIYAAQLANSLRAAPTLSIVMDLDDLFDPETGIYSNPTRSGFEWERPTSVEWITTDGSPGFQVNAGIRIMGGFSRRASKKNSLRLEFRKQYGPSRLQFPLFGDGAAGEFETLALRAHFNDGYTLSSNPHFIRDQWTRATQLAMGQPSSRGTNAHLYINGIYWGLYNPVERPDASFSATYLGGDENDWDAINSNGVVDGTVDAWNELLSLSGPVATAADQQQSNAALLRLLGKDPDGTDNPEVETLLDVDNYIDYMLLNFFTGNNDWPHNNYYMARRRGPESTGFKFYSWDAERSLNNTQGKFADVNTDVTGVSRGVAVLHARLVKNDEFRLMFADRVRRHFSPGGALYVDPANPAWDPENPQRNIPAARYKELADQIALPLVAESARWADALSANPPPTVADWQVLIDGMLENWLPQRPAILLEQLTARGLYPEVAAPEFNQHGGEIVPGFDLTMSAPGDVYYTLDGSDPRQSVLEPGVTESGISPTAIKYSRPVQLTGETPVKARTFADGEWSALSETLFTTGMPTLRVSEIMYHPEAPGTGGSFPDKNDFEFVELVNVSDTSALDLEGFTFTEGIEFTFPAMTLAPGDHVVVVRNVEAFESRYGEDIPIAGQYGGTVDDFKLGNGGETVALVDANGTLIQQLTYDDAWYRSTDGGGFSLEVLQPGQDDLDRFDRAEAWLPSIVVGGTPGAARASASVETGDANLDGQVNAADIDAFVLGLRDPGDYQARYGVPASLGGDTDGDGDLDFDDVGDFVTLVGTGPSSAAMAKGTDVPSRVVHAFPSQSDREARRQEKGRSGRSFETIARESVPDPVWHATVERSLRDEIDWLG